MLFGEQIIIVFQSMIVILLYRYYSNDIRHSHWISLFIIYLFLSSMLLFDLVPEVLFVFSIYVNIMLSNSISIPIVNIVFCCLVP